MAMKQGDGRMKVKPVRMRLKLADAEHLIAHFERKVN
jgi:hypothetical protein